MWLKYIIEMGNPLRRIIFTVTPTVCNWEQVNLFLNQSRYFFSLHLTELLKYLRKHNFL